VSSGLNLVTDGWFVFLALCVALICPLVAEWVLWIIAPTFWCVGYGSLSLMEWYPFLEELSQDWIQSCVYVVKNEFLKRTFFLFNHSINPSSTISMSRCRLIYLGHSQVPTKKLGQFK
jgi:hypothetical protein